MGSAIVWKGSCSCASHRRTCTAIKRLPGDKEGERAADPASRRCPCLGLVVILMYLASHEGEPPTGDLHPIHSRPCWAYTTASSATAARERFGMNVKRYSWA